MSATKNYPYGTENLILIERFFIGYSYREVFLYPGFTVARKVIDADDDGWRKKTKVTWIKGRTLGSLR